MINGGAASLVEEWLLLLEDYQACCGGEVEKKMGLMVKRGENGFGYLEEKVSLKKMVEESGLK